MTSRLLAGLVLATGLSAVQAATVTFEGHFTSRSVFSCAALACSSLDSAIDVTWQRSAQVDFDAAAVLNVSSFPAFGNTFHSAFELTRDVVSATETTYDHELLVGSFGPVPISSAEFDAAGSRFYRTSEIQSLTREVLEDGVGNTSGGAGAWLVGASQNWITFDLVAGTARAWNQTVNFNLRRALPLTVADVQRNWTAGEFWGFVSTAGQPGDQFTVEVVESLQDDVAGPQPTIYYRGDAHIVALEGIPAVPEPQTWLLMLAGGAALLGWRRRT
jgi:hypothetical protein